MRSTKENQGGTRAFSVAVAMLLAAAMFAVVLSAADTDDGRPFSDGPLGDGGDLLNKKNFGGSGTDVFNDVVAVPDGFVAVGYSAASSFGNGDWAGVPGQIEYTNKGSMDAIIVKFGPGGEVLWRYNFGGAGDDEFLGAAVMPEEGGYMILAVGYSGATSFGNGDWTNVTGKGNNDAIIVAFSSGGDVVTAMNFGGAGGDVFNGVTVMPGENGADTIAFAVGSSAAASFGNGDWTGVPGQIEYTNKGSTDAIIVAFGPGDGSGAVIAAKNFGGAGSDAFLDAVAIPGGTVFAVGYSQSPSFGNGDWTGVTGKGGTDAIIVAFGEWGEVIAAKNFGGAGDDWFKAADVRLGENGGDSIVFAAGFSYEASFGNGDWTNVTGKGGTDAIIVAFGPGADEQGEVLAALNFGGAGDDWFESVAVGPGGYVFAVGCSTEASFGTGDWTNVTGKGGTDVIAVAFKDAKVEGAKNYGGEGDDYFYGMTLLPDGNTIAVGFSPEASFGNGDWTGVTGKGGNDATVMKIDTAVAAPGNGGGSNMILYISLAAVAVLSIAAVAYFFFIRK